MKVKVILEALYDVPENQNLEALPDVIKMHGLDPDGMSTIIKVVVKEITDEPRCPSCGAVLTEILAKHDYSIEYSEEQGKWVGNRLWLC